MKKILSIIFIVIMLAGLGVASYFVAKDIETTSADQPVVETPETPSEDENEEGSQVAWAKVLGAHITNRDGDLTTFEDTWEVEYEGKVFVANSFGYVFTETTFYFVKGFYDGKDTFTFYENCTDGIPPCPIISFEDNVLTVDYDGEEMCFPFVEDENGELVFEGGELLHILNLEIKTL